jgi:hypothetical protein
MSGRRLVFGRSERPNGTTLMASNKKRRKRDAVTRRIEGAKPAAASDGDRRRRAFGSLVNDALRRKRSVRDWTIDEGPPPGI